MKTKLYCLYVSVAMFFVSAVTCFGQEDGSMPTDFDALTVATSIATITAIIVAAYLALITMDLGGLAYRRLSKAFGRG